MWCCLLSPSGFSACQSNAHTQERLENTTTRSSQTLIRQLANGITSINSGSIIIIIIHRIGLGASISNTLSVYPSTHITIINKSQYEELRIFATNHTHTVWHYHYIDRISENCRHWAGRSYDTNTHPLITKHVRYVHFVRLPQTNYTVAKSHTHTIRTISVTLAISGFSYSNRVDIGLYVLPKRSSVYTIQMYVTRPMIARLIPEIRHQQLCT